MGKWQKKIKLLLLILIITVIINKVYNISNSHTLGSTEVIYGQLQLENNVMDTTLNSNENIIHKHPVIISTDTFVEKLTEITYRFNEYHGALVEIEGFVYRKQHYTESQFAITRTLVTCCTSHAENLGILSYWNDGEELLDNSWVRVTGKLQSYKYFDENLNKEIITPMIIVEELQIIEKPEDPYLYP